MTKKKTTDLARAKAAFSSYVERLGERLKEDDCPSSILAEARKFFEGQGISLQEMDGEAPSQENQRKRVLQLLDATKKRSG